MAGGTWEFQNKLQPGVYINFRSSPSSLTTVGDRGIVAIARSIDWGTPGEVVTIDTPQDAFDKLGYDISSEQMLFLRQIFRGTTTTNGANRVYVYLLPTTGGVAASVTVGELTATANGVGTRGNEITLVITANPDTEITEGVYAVFTVDTVVDGQVQDSQTIGSYTSESDYTAAQIGDLVANRWVTFSGTPTGSLEATAGSPLTGGTSGVVSTTAYSQFLNAIEPYMFNVIIYDGDDATTKSAFSSFVRRLTTESGIYTQAVMADYASADNETVISVVSSIDLNTGETLTPAQATWWVGGASAGAANYQSLTYAIHPDAVRTDRTTSAQRDDAIRSGNLMLIEEFGAVKILSDINTFTGYTPNKTRAFSKNRTIRVLWSLANDIYNTFSLYYIGKVDNTVVGRNLFKAEIISYCTALQGNGAIQNFTADDVEVLPGTETDAIVINLAIQSVDSVEKVYMTITVS